MKNKFKKLFTSNRHWWSNFSSAFVGTLLGIGITVGINAYVQYQAKEERIHKMLVLTIGDLEERLNVMNSKIKSIQGIDSLFQELECYYPDDAKDVPEKLYNNIYNHLYSQELHTENIISEKLFYNNIEVLDACEDISLIRDIDRLFDFMRQTEKLYVKISDIEQDIRNRIQEDNIRDHTQILEDLFRDKTIYQILENHWTLCQASSQINLMIGALLKIAQQNLEITEEDLNSLNSSRVTLKDESHHIKKTVEMETSQNEKGEEITKIKNQTIVSSETSK